MITPENMKFIDVGELTLSDKILVLSSQEALFGDLSNIVNDFETSVYLPVSALNAEPTLLSSFAANTQNLSNAISAAGFGMTTDGTKELSNVPTITTQNSKIQFKNATGITSEAAISTSNLYPDGSDVATINSLPKATDSKYGVVKLGQATIADSNCAKVGIVSGTDGKLGVSKATAANYGTVRLCTSAPYNSGNTGWSAFTSNGELVILQPQQNARPGVMSPSIWGNAPTDKIALDTLATGDRAVVKAYAPYATSDDFGMVKLAPETETTGADSTVLVLSNLASYNIIRAEKPMWTDGPTIKKDTTSTGTLVINTTPAEDNQDIIFSNATDPDAAKQSTLSVDGSPVMTQNLVSAYIVEKLKTPLADVEALEETASTAEIITVVNKILAALSAV